MARRLGPPVFRPARAALRAAHVATRPILTAPTAGNAPTSRWHPRPGTPAFAGIGAAGRETAPRPGSL